MCLPSLEFTECMTCSYVYPFTDGALKGHFGKVLLGGSPSQCSSEAVVPPPRMRGGVLGGTRM